MKVPLLSTTREYEEIAAEIKTCVEKVLKSGQYILADEVQKFEEAFAARIGSSYAVGVGSGTDALILSLRTLGIEAGDEVITSPFTYFATAEAIVIAGAKPVFADIDPKTFNVNPSKIKEKITPKTKAIIPVHLYGQCAQMDEILQIARKHGLAVIEDAAQAHGACFRTQNAGCFGDTGCFSFYPTKNLGTAGDGGLITFNDTKLKNRLLSLRAHGASLKDRYFHEEFGFNSRLDELQAAVLNAKLSHLDKWNEKRQKIAAGYTKAIGQKSNKIKPPFVGKDHDHVFHQYVVRTPYRDKLASYLSEKGISSAVFYKNPLHLLPPLKQFGCKKGDFPEAEKAANEVLSLPCFPQMTDREVEYVIETILAFKL
jgi:dTDP-4-amino-4,6-dideoxygalactose transaminase